MLTMRQVTSHGEIRPLSGPTFVFQLNYFLNTLVKATLCVMLLAMQTTRITVLCWTPVVSLNYVKQAASNQASTNERFRPTSSYDSTPLEYVNDNEKYEFTRMKIIHKIKSSVPIVVEKDSALIGKKTMVVNSDYNSMVGEEGHGEVEHKARNADRHEKFLTAGGTHGKCMGKWQIKQASIKPSLLITSNDATMSYRSALKRMVHHHILNVGKGRKVENFKMKDISNDLPSSFGTVSQAHSMQNDHSNESNRRIQHHRARRQLRYIPALRHGSSNLQPLQNPFHDIVSPVKHQRPSNKDSAFIHSLLGVFDKTHPILGPNIRPIKPNEVIITPPRYIDDAKIFPKPLKFRQPSPSYPSGDIQLVKNRERNPSGFGESERVLTTDVTDTEKQPQIIQDYFLPTIKPTIPKKPSSEHGVDVKADEDYLQNHRIPSAGESIPSSDEDLYNAHEIPGQRGSYKHHGKDTKYDPFKGKYTFQYQVVDSKTINDFGHQESRNEQITQGNYHVRLPDGRLQRVTYHVDGAGYHANVSYESNNKYYYK